MEIVCESIDDLVVVRASGSVDGTTRHQLGEVSCFRSFEHNAILVLTEVDFMDSAGLSTLVQIIRGFRDSSCKLVLADPPKNVLKLLEMTSIDRIVPIVDSFDDAQALLREG